MPDAKAVVASRPRGGVVQWRRALETNLWAPYAAFSFSFQRRLRPARPGAVICTGSKRGITLLPGDVAYNVSKAALKASTDDLLKQTGKHVTEHLLIPGEAAFTTLRSTGRVHAGLRIWHTGLGPDWP